MYSVIEMNRSYRRMRNSFGNNDISSIINDWCLKNPGTVEIMDFLKELDDIFLLYLALGVV